MNAISLALFEDATKELEEIPQFYVRRIVNDSLDVVSLVFKYDAHVLSFE